jgi:hypothetical protein
LDIHWGDNDIYRAGIVEGDGRSFGVGWCDYLWGGGQVIKRVDLAAGGWAYNRKTSGAKDGP